MPRRSSRSAPSQDDVEMVVEEEVFEGGASQEHFMFSQQVPEASQSVLPEKANERRKFDEMDPREREKALTSLSRHVLFKALDREPIDRLKAIKEAGINESRISGAIYQEVAQRFRNVFGFELKQTPPFMQQYKTLPAKFRDRYYVVNAVQDTDDGRHSKSIHSVHPIAKVEKGVLILTIALIFCNGESRKDGSRHLLGRDLYRLMHTVDENIPAEPPAQGTARAKATNVLQKMSTTPNFDVMLENFVAWDYLVKDKANEENFLSQTTQEGDVIYSMGPRAALELGRKQIITFCAEVLGEEPDPSMLKEIEGDGQGQDEEIFMEAAPVH